MDSGDLRSSRSKPMNPVRKSDSLQYFVAMIAQMATTLREFGMPDAASSLEMAKSQIEARLSENKKAG